MPRTPSSMVPLGTLQPDFELPDASGRPHRLQDCRGPRGTLVMFLCNHCPFVHHVASTVREISEHAKAAGIGAVGIMSNDFKTHPDDSPPRMREAAATWGWRFPYLVDAAQTAAKSHGAACTPDFFLYDEHGRLFYRGQLDASRPGNDIASDGSDLRRAIDSLLAGAKPPSDQLPSLGCNIKWLPEPGGSR